MSDVTPPELVTVELETDSGMKYKTKLAPNDPRVTGEAQAEAPAGAELASTGKARSPAKGSGDVATK